MNKEIFDKRKKALSSNNGEDYYDLAQCYEVINQFGNPNPFYDNYRRIYWYLKSGIKGYGEAFNNIGFIIEHELLNVKKRKKKATKYYKLAYQLGSQLGKENYLLMLKDKKE